MKILKVFADAVCDVGAVRKNNEDMAALDSLIFRDGAYQMELVTAESGGYLLLAVADGIGGANAGEAASEFLLEELYKAKQQIPAVDDPAVLKRYLEECVKNIHESINRQGDENPEKHGMGATLIAVFMSRDKVYFISAGDSRLYRFRRGILKQISRDHSLASVAGLDRNASHVILNAVGGGSSSFIDFADITNLLINGDALLLCSDGLTDMLDDDVIEQQLEKELSSPPLCELAKKNGGKDNISILLARLETIDEPGEE